MSLDPANAASEAIKAADLDMWSKEGKFRCAGCDMYHNAEDAVIRMVEFTHIHVKLCRECDEWRRPHSQAEPRDACHKALRQLEAAADRIWRVIRDTPREVNPERPMTAWRAITDCANELRAYLDITAS